MPAPPPKTRAASAAIAANTCLINSFALPSRFEVTLQVGWPTTSLKVQGERIPDRNEASTPSPVAAALHYRPQ